MPIPTFCRRGTRLPTPISRLVASLWGAPLALGVPVAAQEVQLPAGFVLEPAADVTESILACTFERGGDLIVSLEGGSLLRLIDTDGDGFFEARESFCEELRDCQGLLDSQDGSFYAVGFDAGGGGLFRLPPVEGDGVRRPQRLLSIAGDGEHGAHAVVDGPDGALYVALGNMSHFIEDPAPDSVCGEGYEGALLRTYLDPNGHAADVRYPGGIVARVERETWSWTVHSVGYRNHYDLAFDASGELFTCDSDMEWDVGLPWYRPVRILHCVYGADYGSRTGSSVWPEYYADSYPGVAALGRGSPTGVLLYDGDQFPGRYRGALFVGDWSHGRIVALPLTPDGQGGYSGSAEDWLVAGEGSLAVTDLALAPDGSIVFTCGGRGTAGRVARVRYAGRVEPREGSDGPPAANDEAAAVHALQSADAAARRRAATWFARHPELALAHSELLEEALGSAQRRVRYAARRALEIAELDPWRAGRILAGDSVDWTRALEKLWIRVRSRGEPGVPLDALADAFYAQPKGRAMELDFLRALQVAFLSDDDSAAVRPGALGERLLARFPASDVLVAREQAILIAHLEPSGSIAALLAALDATKDRAQQIHYAYCLHQIEGGWDGTSAARLLSWFERSAAWSGGMSLPGYLAAMRRTFVETRTPDEALALSRDGGLDAHSLALFVERLPAERAVELLPRLDAAWTAMPIGERGSPEHARKSAVLRELVGARTPGLDALLREWFQGDGKQHEALWIALAGWAAAEDWNVLVQGLATPSREVREASAEALAKLDQRPPDAFLWRGVLDTAARFGWPRGRVHLDVLSHWRGAGPRPSGEAEWEDAMGEWEGWFAGEFPDYRRPAVDVAPRPTWSGPAMAAFLERSSSRAGSGHRGADVYVKATCATCHVIEGLELAPTAAGISLGPDLSTVASRFSRQELLESMIDPSRVISDLFATHVVFVRGEDGEEERYDGRIVSRGTAGGGLRLLMSDGSELEFAPDELVRDEVSTLSMMPEGLLSGLTLEEIKDLLAFLEDPRSASAQAPESDWRRFTQRASADLWEGSAEHWTFANEGLLGKSDGLETSEYLLSKVEFADFEVEFDMRIAPGGNSGFQYRSSPSADGTDPVGYQADAGQRFWGAIYATDGRGELVSADESRFGEFLDALGWNHFYLRVAGDEHYLEINGVPVAELVDGAFERGAIGFQLHSGKGMQVRVANGRIRALP